MEQRADGVLRRTEVYDYFLSLVNTDATLAEILTIEFMQKYSDDGENVYKGTLYERMAEFRDQELREVRRNDLKVQAERNKKFEWWGGWYDTDTDLDDKLTRDDLIMVFQNEEDADAVLNVVAPGRDHIMRDETYKWVMEVEEPGKARIWQL